MNPAAKTLFKAVLPFIKKNWKQGLEVLLSLLTLIHVVKDKDGDTTGPSLALPSPTPSSTISPSRPSLWRRLFSSGLSRKQTLVLGCILFTVIAAGSIARYPSGAKLFWDNSISYLSNGWGRALVAIGWTQESEPVLPPAVRIETGGEPTPNPTPAPAAPTAAPQPPVVAKNVMTTEQFTVFAKEFNDLKETVRYLYGAHLTPQAQAEIRALTPKFDTLEQQLALLTASVQALANRPVPSPATIASQPSGLTEQQIVAIIERRVEAKVRAEIAALPPPTALPLAAPASVATPPPATSWAAALPPPVSAPTPFESQGSMKRVPGKAEPVFANAYQPSYAGAQWMLVNGEKYTVKPNDLVLASTSPKSFGKPIRLRRAEDGEVFEYIGIHPEEGGKRKMYVLRLSR